MNRKIHYKIDSKDRNIFMVIINKLKYEKKMKNTIKFYLKLF